jgi:uncharacterized membrane protein
MDTRPSGAEVEAASSRSDRTASRRLVDAYCEFLCGRDEELGERLCETFEGTDGKDEFVDLRGVTLESRCEHPAAFSAKSRSGGHMTLVVSYVAALVAFVAADMVWLGIMVERVYRPAIGDILSTSVNLPAAIVFYLIFPVGLTIFAVLPAVKDQSAAHAALFGGLFGFFSYATYDLTNQATLRNWPTQLTVIDLAWGSVLAAFAATIGYLASSRF